MSLDSSFKSLLICRFILALRREDARRTGQSASLSLPNLQSCISVEDSSSGWMASLGGPVYSAFIDAEGDFDHHAEAATTDFEAVRTEAVVMSEVVAEEAAQGS